MFFLLIFWSIPVAAIQALANLEEIFALFHGDAEQTLGSKENVVTMQGLLAVLILDIWLGIIPLIAELLTFFQRKGYRGKHEMLVMTKYFDCLLFMVLLVTVITGSALNGANSFQDYAQNIVDSISEVINHLATGLSNMSCYFLLYVLLNAFFVDSHRNVPPRFFLHEITEIARAEQVGDGRWWLFSRNVLRTQNICSFSGCAENANALCCSAKVPLFGVVFEDDADSDHFDDVFCDEPNYVDSGFGVLCVRGLCVYIQSVHELGA